MVKRITAFIFILLANIVLLAHAVVPHQHYFGHVCIGTEHSQDNEATHESNSTEPDHKHDGNNTSTSCVLKQAVVLPTNQSRQECDYISYTDNNSTKFLFALFNSGTESAVLVLLCEASDKVIIPSYSSFVNTSLGLRAPPVV